MQIGGRHLVALLKAAERLIGLQMGRINMQRADFGARAALRPRGHGQNLQLQELANAGMV